jgi:N4-gp56 family major capsid protein
MADTPKLTTFVPELWSARLLSNLNTRLVFGDKLNREYEGEIKSAGDTVHIPQIGRITIGDYERNVDMASPEALTDADLTLIIDKMKTFNFAVDDVDKAQSKPAVMEEAMKEAGYGLAKTADTLIATLLGALTTTAAGELGTTAAPTSLTVANAAAYEQFVNAGVLMDEADIDSVGRWAVIPAWMHGRLLLDPRFISAGTSKTDGVLENGHVGRAANFNISVSNQLVQTAGTKYKTIFGTNAGGTFADQINKVEAYRPEKRFSDAVKGLHVYGMKVVRPKCFVIGTYNKT